MCGIVGHFERIRSRQPTPPAVYDEALSRLHHRGPDAQGRWRSADGACWLGHTRLAIVDLAQGQQPMLSPDGALAVSFNGEIYNFMSLRRELEAAGYVFRTRSDTEVLLHGYHAWGGRGLCERLRGIFAFGLYDQRRRTLFLARDHFGVKPLYWWSDGYQVVFASELKALLAFPAVLAQRKVNLRGVAQMVVSRAVARPETLLEGVMRLPEGYCVEFQVDRPLGVPQRYWDSRFEPEPIDPEAALEQLEQRVRTVVDEQLMSDVPVGVQLSGGVDSSLVTAMMATLRRSQGITEPVKSFSVGFTDERYSELKYARQVAERYGTEHHEITLDPDTLARRLIPGAWYYDEPMGEPCAVPTLLMCEHARRQGITVMLTGEGADEIFGGYTKYAQELVAGRLHDASLGLLNHAVGLGARLLPERYAKARRALAIVGMPQEARRMASWYGGFNAAEQRRVLSDALRANVGDGGLRAAFESLLLDAPDGERLARFMYVDRHARLVDHILVKGDRMSMAAGVEARVPFLDWTLADFAGRLPASLKLHGNQRKWLLCRLAERYIPPAVIHRPKVGFAIPVREWLQGPLSEFLQHTVLSDRSLARGYFDADHLKRLVTEHRDGRANHDAALWQLMALELWHRLYVDDNGSAEAVHRVAAELGQPVDFQAAGRSAATATVQPETPTPLYA